MVTKKSVLLALSVGILGMSATTASAEEPAQIVKQAEVKNNYPGLIKNVVKSGTEIKETFNVSPQIRGYVLKSGAKHSLVYSVGDHVFSGVIFDKNGTNVTKALQDKYIPVPDVNDAVAEIERIGKYVQEGTGDKTIYVFVDPQCPHCHDYYKATRNLVRGGEVTIKWMTVGFLSPKSRDKAAYILSAENPVQAMTDIELGYEPPKADNKQLRQVAINQELMQKAGVMGTPGILYKKGGNWVMAKNGLDPKKILSTVE